MVVVDLRDVTSVERSEALLDGHFSLC